MPNMSENELVQSRRRPRFGKIPAAVDYSGVSRTVLYEMREDTPAAFPKEWKGHAGGLRHLDELLDRFP